MSGSLKQADATELVGESEESLLCFTLTGEEHVDTPLATRKTLGDAHILCRLASLHRAGYASHWHSECMLTAGVVCSGVTVVGQDSLPSFHEPTVWNPVMYDSNNGVCTMVTEQEAEVLPCTRGQDTQFRSASYADIHPLLVS